VYEIRNKFTQLVRGDISIYKSLGQVTIAQTTIKLTLAMLTAVPFGGVSKYYKRQGIPPEITCYLLKRFQS
jgi:hypothetical protein